MKFQETIEFINANYNSKMAICLNNDDIAIFEKYFKGNDFLYNIIPDKTEFRRRIRENRVMIEDHFIKSERNVDYLDKDDFSLEIIYTIKKMVIWDSLIILL